MEPHLILRHPGHQPVVGCMQIVRITINLVDTEVQRDPNAIAAPAGAGVIACVANQQPDARQKSSSAA
jgi:hypothetical protein